MEETKQVLKDFYIYMIFPECRFTSVAFENALESESQ